MEFGHQADSSQSVDMHNMRSAALNPQVIDKYIEQESEAGNIIGPLLFHILSCYPLTSVRSYADITRPP